MAGGVGEGLTQHTQQRLPLVTVNHQPRLEVESKAEAVAVGEALGDMGDGDVEGFVVRTAQRADGLAGVVEGPFRRLGQRREDRIFLAATARLAGQEEELVGQAVVQVTGDPAAFLESGGVGHGLPVVTDLGRRRGDQHCSRRQPQRVAREHPLRKKRRVEHEAHPAERQEDGSGRDPREVGVGRGRLGEARAGGGEEPGAGKKEGDESRMPEQVLHVAGSGSDRRVETGRQSGAESEQDVGQRAEDEDRSNHEARRHPTAVDPTGTDEGGGGQARAAVENTHRRGPRPRVAAFPGEDHVGESREDDVGEADGEEPTQDQ